MTDKVKNHTVAVIDFLKKETSKSINTIRYEKLNSEKAREEQQKAKNKKTDTTEISKKSAYNIFVTDIRVEVQHRPPPIRRYHRLFVNQIDADSQYHRVGWVVNEDIKNCMVCNRSFSGTLFYSLNKHHCRACGNVVCNNCSSAEAWVAGATAAGLQRVCNVCNFGQEIVAATYNDNNGIGVEKSPVTLEENPVAFLHYDPNEEKSLGVCLWDFGNIELQEVVPFLVLRTSRQNRSKLYVNICYSAKVPYNDSVQILNSRLIYMVCGPVGKNSTGDAVYDVVVSNREITRAMKPGIVSQEKTELCEQALLCISTLTKESDFATYVIEHSMTYILRDQSNNDTTTPTAINPVNEDGSRRVFMAIPSSYAIHQMYQCCVTSDDMHEPDHTIVATKEQLHAFATAHKKKIIQKFESTKLSEVKEVTTYFGEELDGDYKWILLEPFPGFVIKTKYIHDSQKKVFINVYHHSHVAIIATRQNVIATAQPFVMVGEEGDVSDKNGSSSALFHVVVDSKYFLESFEGSSKITDNVNIQKIIAAVNERYERGLDAEAFSLPRVKGGFKGEWNDSLVFSYKPVEGAAMSSVEDRYDQYLQQSTTMSMNEEKEDHFMPLPTIAGGQQNLHTRESFSSAQGGDNESVTSDITTSTYHRGSISRNNSGDDIDPKLLLTSDMMQIVRTENIDYTAVMQLKQISMKNPSVLIGWQITLFDRQGKQSVVVITGVRKNYLSKSEFRVSLLNKPDQWVRLRRAPTKGGLSFTPLRKVLFTNNATTNANANNAPNNAANTSDNINAPPLPSKTKQKQ